MPNHLRETRECPHCGSMNMGFDGKEYAPGYETCQVVCECCGMRGPPCKGGCRHFCQSCSALEQIAEERSAMLRMTHEEYLKLLRRSGARGSPLTPDIDKHVSAPKPPKYRNHRVYVYQDGLICQEKLEGHGGIALRLDSVKEYDRWNDLQLLERAGAISNLQRQVPLIIQEAFRGSTGKRQRSIAYRADFTYTEKGQDIVEDVKAFAKDRGKYLTTESFNIKWKLLQRLYPQKTFRIF